MYDCLRHVVFEDRALIRAPTPDAFVVYGRSIGVLIIDFTSKAAGHRESVVVSRNLSIISHVATMHHNSFTRYDGRAKTAETAPLSATNLVHSRQPNASNKLHCRGV